MFVRFSLYYIGFILYGTGKTLRGFNMEDNGQFEKLNNNYDELDDEKKLKLLLIGENLLNIQNIVNEENKTENQKLNTE